jgi:hypothetical protein
MGIALTAHGMPDPVEVSYLPHPAFPDSRHEQPGDESLPVERCLLTIGVPSPGHQRSAACRWRDHRSLRSRREQA